MTIAPIVALGVASLALVLPRVGRAYEFSDSCRVIRVQAHRAYNFLEAVDQEELVQLRSKSLLATC